MRDEKGGGEWVEDCVRGERVRVGDEMLLVNNGGMVRGMKGVGEGGENMVDEDYRVNVVIAVLVRDVFVEESE
ncbi:Rossmann-fold NAD(P)-binding domain-containing protein [Bacillus pumilus]|uniref:hypothetical protein n=1 Tax=Bacillus pumilus TaxID=1408 RepID=UPI0011A4832C|nr:hypothetical protein [Bacillus pumilus]